MRNVKTVKINFKTPLKRCKTQLRAILSLIEKGL